MRDQLEAIYKNICVNVSNMEAAYVHQNDDDFYSSLVEVDTYLDLLREIIEG